MVAFLSTILVLVVGCAILVPFAKRYPQGTRLTWGQAMAAGTYVFFLIFWAYGVVPHYWLTWASNELNWRQDVLLAEYDWFGFLTLGFFEPAEFGGWFPMTIHMAHVMDLIVVLQYIVMLGIQIWLWAWWQQRGTKEPVKDLTTSDYGRPLVRKG
ncbi:MAG: hypothetical protein JJU45_17850 [Acidimicrobiia bacterium]|nr:hypothetical protein [Acidimicrobiia bacterium]